MNPVVLLSQSIHVSSNATCFWNKKLKFFCQKLYYPCMYVVLCSFISVLSLQTQAQSFQWAQRTSSGYLKTAISVDASGNSYTTGTFTGTVVFGSYTLISAGSQDIYIAKYNSAGVVQWARRVGGSLGESSGDIYVDNASGYVYLTGSFKGTAAFTSYHGIVSASLTSAGSDDVFVSRYNAGTGTLSWARKGGGPNADRAYGITVDNSGNCYITGLFYGAASFGSGYNVVSSGASDADMFIAKYNSAGTIVGVKDPVGDGYDFGSAIATDALGNIYVTGGFSTYGIFFGTSGSTIHYLPGTAIAYVTDMFVVKYNSSLQAQWARQATGNSIDSGNDLVADNAGNVYVTGSFYSSALTFYNYGYPVPPVVSSVSGSGGSDMFLAKYNAAGSFQWVRKAGGSSYEEGAGIAKNSTGSSIYVTGSFSGTTTFTSSGASEPLTAAGGASDKDVFVVKYNASGTIGWKQKGGGSATTKGESIGVDNGGNTYISGYSSGTSTFSSTPAFSGSGGFIARLNPPLIILFPVFPMAVRINCGGPAVTTGGLSFSADNSFSATSIPGSTSSTTDIANTTSDVLYRTDRVSDTNLGSFSYNIPVINGSYQVKLHFAEVYWGVDGRSGGVGTRVLSANIEGGTTELVNFDITASVGTQKAVIKSYLTTVSDGTLTISFSAAANRPKICAIEVVPASSARIAAAAQESITENSLSLQVYPNPMVEQANITFEITQTEVVILQAYDMQGRVVAHLFEGEAVAGRAYELEWNGSQLTAGMYIVKLTAGSKTSYQKIMITR